MTAIPASSVSLKTMADGTLRITFDIEPAKAQDAFKLFAAPGTSVAIAALKDGHAAKSDKPAKTEKPKADPDELKGGALAKLAGQWCNAPEFWAWLEELEYMKFENGDMAEQAAAQVRKSCYIKSRKELDHNEAAAQRFHQVYRAPFQAYMVKHGIVL